MTRLRSLAVALFLTAPLLNACIVPVREEVRPPPPMCRAVWVAGHYGAAGYWHPGHWVCT